MAEVLGRVVFPDCFDDHRRRSRWNERDAKKAKQWSGFFKLLRSLGSDMWLPGVAV